MKNFLNVVNVVQLVKNFSVRRKILHAMSKSFDTDLSSYDSATLDFLFDDNYKKIMLGGHIQHPFLSCVNMKIKMELLKRGYLNIKGPAIEHVRLFRWAYLHRDIYPEVNVFLENTLKSNNILKLNNAVYHLLSNRTFTVEEWKNIIQNFSGIRPLIYHEQGRFLQCDNPIIATDTSPVVIFREQPTQENAYAFVEAVRELFKKYYSKDKAKKDVNIDNDLYRMLGKEILEEFKRVNLWIQDCYPHEDLLIFCDLCLNENSPWRLIFELSNYSFESLSLSKNLSGDIDLIL